VPAELLDEGVEAGFLMDFLQPVVESVDQLPRNLVPGHVHRPLPLALAPHAIAHSITVMD
jgi:hypothetical protein